MGPNIALYDPLTTALIQTLASPECVKVISTAFINRGSRYLAISGHRDVILWDLVSQSGEYICLIRPYTVGVLILPLILVKWHYRSSQAITRLVANPVQDTFLVFERPAESLPSAVVTRVVIFTSRSAIPTQSRSLPFHLLSVVPCPANWIKLNAASSSAFVAITDSWSVVLLGDDVKLPQEEGSTGRGLKGSAPTAKRTLFQDIFGASAFVGVAPSPPVIEKPAGWKGKEVEKIFDAPAYLMPPLDTLFEPLMEDFLTLRKPEDTTEGEDIHAEEDIEMDAEGDDGPILVGNRLERTVGGGEMAAMVELFMNHAICKFAIPGLDIESIADYKLHSYVNTPLPTTYKWYPSSTSQRDNNPCNALESAYQNQRRHSQSHSFACPITTKVHRYTCENWPEEKEISRLNRGCMTRVDVLIDLYACSLRFNFDIHPNPSIFPFLFS